MLNVLQIQKGIISNNKFHFMKPFEVFLNSKSPSTKYHEKPVTDSQTGGKVLKEDLCGFLFLRIFYEQRL